jgi:hypothetical protein
LYQEFHGVVSSSRQIILPSKSEMNAAIIHASHDPIEKHMGELLGRTRILSEDLKLLAVQVCDTTGVSFEGAHPLRLSTKREVLEWSGLGRIGQTLARHFRRSEPISEEWVTSFDLMIQKSSSKE